MKLKQTTTEKLGKRIIVKHHQTLRQSVHYQSAEVSYGVEFEVAGNKAAIEAGIHLAESIVENAIAGKYQQQHELLCAIAKKAHETES